MLLRTNHLWWEGYFEQIVGRLSSTVHRSFLKLGGRGGAYFHRHIGFNVLKIGLGVPIIRTSIFGSILGCPCLRKAPHILLTKGKAFMWTFFVEVGVQEFSCRAFPDIKPLRANDMKYSPKETLYIERPYSSKVGWGGVFDMSYCQYYVY